MRAERHLLFWLTAAVLVLAGIAMLREVLLPFVVGAIVAYFLNPVANSLEERGFSRTLAAAILVAIGAIVLILAIIFLVPLLANQLRQLSESLPGDLARLRAGIEAWAAGHLGDRFPQFQAGLERALSDLAQSWSGSMGTVARSIWSQGLALINLVSLLLITPVVVFYFLVDWHPMLARIDSWLPRENAPVIRRLAGDINEAVAAFIRGQGTICLILGTFYGIGLMLVGLRYGLVIGFATGLLTFVPFVGWAVGAIGAVSMALMQAWPDISLLVKVGMVLVAGQIIESVFLSPKIVGEKIGLHPVWLMFALFSFSYLFGFVGTLVAVPVSAAIGVLVRYGLEVYLGSSVYLGNNSAGPGHAAPGSEPGGAP